MKQKRKKFGDIKIAVIGDCGLDRYFCGEVHRISPEAPIPVLKYTKEFYRPGLAANVAANVLGLGGKALLFAPQGEDRSGITLRTILIQSGMDPVGFQECAITTTKDRFVCGNHQLLRMDTEESVTKGIQDEVLNEFLYNVGDMDAVIIADYAKGMIDQWTAQSIIRIARGHDIPVFVDPKQGPEIYKGAFVVTPNMKEFCMMAGKTPKTEQEIEKTAREMIAKYKWGAIVLTRGDQGLSLYEGHKTGHISAEAREVYDVSGAGDTVIATLALMYCTGADLLCSCKLANKAAGIVVGKLGTTAITELDFYGVKK